MNEARYREVEQQLWASVGISPTERRVPLACTGTTVRVQVVGDGPPVLFLHGAPNAGSTWAPIIPHFAGYRCLIVDRPGTGLSDDFRLTRNIATVADWFVGDLLDALGEPRAHIVASSFGGFLALRSAAATPDRVDRMVQMSCPALAPGMTVPPFMRGLSNPFICWLAPKLPPSKGYNLRVLRDLGHGASLEAKRIPDLFHDWYLALQRHTPLMRNEIALIAAAISGKGIDQATALDANVLSRVQAPTLFLWGEADGFGGPGVARGVTAAMPSAALELFPDFGHLPWMDDPDPIGARTVAFLGGN
jgi:pimeloyl-ACP methyl ester carboxylesterase